MLVWEHKCDACGCTGYKKEENNECTFIKEVKPKNKPRLNEIIQLNLCEKQECEDRLVELIDEVYEILGLPYPERSDWEITEISNRKIDPNIEMLKTDIHIKMTIFRECLFTTMTAFSKLSEWVSMDDSRFAIAGAITIWEQSQLDCLGSLNNAKSNIKSIQEPWYIGEPNYDNGSDLTWAGGEEEAEIL